MRLHKNKRNKNDYENQTNINNDHRRLLANDLEEGCMIKTGGGKQKIKNYIRTLYIFLRKLKIKTPSDLHTSRP